MTPFQIHCKGMTPFDVDVTGLFDFSGNTERNPNVCVIPLDGDGRQGVDRRFSVFKTERTMPSIVAEQEGFYRPDGSLDDGKGDAADKWIKRESARVIETDMAELGKWLGNMLVRHGITDEQGNPLVDRFDMPSCFHGNDYDFYVDGQSIILKEVLHQVFITDQVPFIGVVPLCKIYQDHFRANGGDPKYMKKRGAGFEPEVERFLSSKGLSYDPLNSVNVVKKP
jgi:hypothetical protein